MSNVVNLYDSYLLIVVLDKYKIIVYDSHKVAERSCINDDILIVRASEMTGKIGNQIAIHGFVIDVFSL